MKDLMKVLMQPAEILLEQDGYISPVLFLFKDKKLITPPILIRYTGDEQVDEKAEVVYKAGFTAGVLDADCIIIIHDAAFRTIESLDGMDVTDSPLSFPKSMRTECIMMIGIELPSGKKEMLITAYKGGDGTPVEFLRDFKMPEDVPFDSRFTDLAIKGWEDADNAKAER